MDHCESGESGLAMANILYDVIVETESKESLLAMGSGKFNRYLLCSDFYLNFLILGLGFFKYRVIQYS